MEVTTLLAFTFCLQFLQIEIANAEFCQAIVPTKELEVYEVDYCLKECSLALRDKACFTNCKTCMRTEVNNAKSDTCGEKCVLKKLKKKDVCPSTPTVDDVNAFKGKKCLEECLHHPQKATVCLTKCIECMNRNLDRSESDSCDLRCAFKKLRNSMEEEWRVKCLATPSNKVLRSYTTEYCLHDCEDLPYSSGCFTKCKKCIKKRVRVVRANCRSKIGCTIKQLKKEYLESGNSQQKICRTNMWSELNTKFSGKRCTEHCKHIGMPNSSQCMSQCRSCFQTILQKLYDESNLFTMSPLQKWRKVSEEAVENEKAFCKCYSYDETKTTNNANRRIAFSLEK